MTLADARGVEIAPGDTAIYGFGVGRSVAMAEAVVLGEHRPSAMPDQMGDEPPCTCGLPWGHPFTPSVSLTPSGRVRLRVVRRSYSSGTKPVVDVAPDRLVVLKLPYWATVDATPHLPPSPLPTQDEQARAEIQRDIDQRVENLRLTEAPEWWINCEPAGTLPEAAFANFAVWQTKKLKELRRKLRDLDE